MWKVTGDHGDQQLLVLVTKFFPTSMVCKGLSTWTCINMDAIALHCLVASNSFFLCFFCRWIIKWYPFEPLKQLTKNLGGKVIWAMWHCLSTLHTSWEAGFVMWDHVGPCPANQVCELRFKNYQRRHAYKTGWWNCRRNPRFNLPAQKNIRLL